MTEKNHLCIVLFWALLVSVFFTGPNTATASEMCPDCQQAVEQLNLALPQNPILSVLDSGSPSSQEEICILVDTARRVLTILADGEPRQQYPVAVGKYETPTPVGEFKVLRRARNWGTGFGTRWIGLTVPWGIYGIHGTNKPYSIGSFASHGCIRMNNKHVEEIYPLVEPGTRVIIIGNAFRYQKNEFRTMRRDFRGGDVVEIQIRLNRLGYYDGPIDGIWGGGMERAVLAFRNSKELSHDNAVDADFYRLLGL